MISPQVKGFAPKSMVSICLRCHCIFLSCEYLVLVLLLAETSYICPSCVLKALRIFSNSYSSTSVEHGHTP
jgi:hypothetical protein